MEIPRTNSVMPIYVGSDMVVAEHNVSRNQIPMIL